MKKLILSIIAFIFLVSLAQAQSNKQPPPTSKGDDYYNNYKYENKKSNKKIQRKKSRKSSISVYYDKKIEEFHARMKENSKRYKKMNKEMKKPQYSDPTYFGHKNPPKKNPPGKKKFCKECEIVH